MANPKQAQQDILDSRELIGCVLADVDGRLYINSMQRTPAIAEAGLPLNERNTCQIRASLADDVLSDFAIEGKSGKLPHLDLGRLIVEHKILGGHCMCFLKLSTGNLSEYLRALRSNCERLTINLGNISPLLQFIILCRLALGLSLPDAGNETHSGDLSLSLEAGLGSGASSPKGRERRKNLVKKD
ncbi:hypothetical protein GGR51DRAFT_566551 [Nemania sp. FL0031]|nr:hypothetical protein GGR51DRAFT_566551 [Nemania sp. FL0031]